MAKTIVLLQYNNYFNRVVKGQEFTTIGAYESDGARIVGQITNMVLWNPNDGVNTEITSSLELYSIPDYLLVIEDGTIVQRWFVMEARRLQKTQYRLRLRRDLLAENYNIVMFNPDSYIERGWCDVSDPAIYNQEPLTFNQIKKEQHLLHDVTGVPWIVGYLQTYGEFPTSDISFKLDGSTVKFNLSNATKSQVFGAPYTLFYMPFGDCNMIRAGSTVLQTTELSQAVAMEISRSLSGAGWLMDLQLVPFCPMLVDTDEYKSVSVPGTYSEIHVINPEGADTVSGYICYTTLSSREGSCFENSLTNPENKLFSYEVKDIKEEANTTFLRIISPNGNGAYEFVPAKSVYSPSSITFSYRFTYMPYQPYIKIEAGFKRMYGANYDDARGLICGGDFSMPQITDQWKTYQLNNKNYQIMFNRQVESLDLQNKWAKRQDIANAATGTISGIIGGVMLGGVAGGVVGGVASAAAGGLDVYANKQIRADQKDAMLQQFDWQNQNIQALPNTVTKLTNFNDETPKVPYIEIYTCTDEEKNNFKKYLALRDYTINRYGKFVDYIKPNDGKTFLRGTLLRLEGVQDDTHYIAAIADEVKQGFYVGTDSETNAGG